MVYRTVSVADREFTRMRDCIEQPLAGLAHRGFDRAEPACILRQQCGNRRGQGASGAVGVAGFDSGGRQFDHAVAVEQQVGELIAGQVAALEQHPAFG
ncbi:hypothetical protein SDC9_206469 [bioreactor metagenome]|uniref:Uncharacterized protein n=1 Tax=bioreactor metagenome TaxID=1076179 RepID=A0A645J5M8_9ZZZZ